MAVCKRPTRKGVIIGHEYALGSLPQGWFLGKSRDRAL